MTRAQRIYKFYLKNEGLISAIAFVFGFIFDITFLNKIDDPFSIVQQCLYILVICGVFILQVWPEEWIHAKLPSWLHKAWNYRDVLMHFCFGSLLNIYTLFFFKSSSIAVSLVFMLLVAALIIANEIPRFRKFGVRFQSILLMMCLLGFWTLLVPVVLGFIGAIPFLIAIVLSALGIYSILYILRSAGHDESYITKNIVYPAAGVLFFYAVFYFVGWIPPVPLSLEKSGIYHEVQKQDGHYVLFHERPSWKFWQSGDQDFYAEPGDKIYFYARVFAPTRFQDQLKVRWLYKDAKQGWLAADAIPMNVSGGREEGFRAYAFKNNYSAGKWRVQVESSDGREIGRLNFEVISVETPQAGRAFYSEKD